MAEVNDTLIKIDGLVITEKMLADDIYANAKQSESLLLSEKNLNDYIDIYYREKLFEHLALKDKLEQSKEFEAMLTIAKRRLLVNYFVNQKKAKIKIPDMSQSAKEFYLINKEQFKVASQIEIRHILLKSTPDSPEREDVRDKLNKILLELKKNPNEFELLAKKYSEDKGSASSGGYLGKVSKGRMVAEFEQEAFKLKETEQLSDVFSTKYGFHIVQLIKKHPAYIGSFEEAKEQIVDKLRRDYLETEYMSWRKKMINPDKAEINKEKLQTFVQKIVAQEKLKGL